MHIPDQESRGHISDTKSYYFIGSLLLVLTGITVGVAYMDIGQYFGGFAMNITVAILVATCKAYLVLMYFMHMKHEDKLIWGFGIIYPLVIFVILITFLAQDVFLRKEVKPGMHKKSSTSQVYISPDQAGVASN